MGERVGIAPVRGVSPLYIYHLASQEKKGKALDKMTKTKKLYKRACVKIVSVQAT